MVCLGQFREGQAKDSVQGLRLMMNFELESPNFAPGIHDYGAIQFHSKPILCYARTTELTTLAIPRWPCSSTSTPGPPNVQSSLDYHYNGMHATASIPWRNRTAKTWTQCFANWMVKQTYYNGALPVLPPSLLFLWESNDGRIPWLTVHWDCCNPKGPESIFLSLWWIL